MGIGTCGTRVEVTKIQDLPHAIARLTEVQKRAA